MEEKLTHFDEKGNAIMVDVNGKEDYQPDGDGIRQDSRQ